MWYFVAIWVGMVGTMPVYQYTSGDTPVATKSLCMDYAMDYLAVDIEYMRVRGYELQEVTCSPVVDQSTRDIDTSGVFAAPNGL